MGGVHCTALCDNGLVAGGSNIAPVAPNQAPCTHETSHYGTMVNNERFRDFRVYFVIMTILSLFYDHNTHYYI